MLVKHTNQYGPEAAILICINLSFNFIQINEFTILFDVGIFKNPVDRQNRDTSVSSY